MHCADRQQYYSAIARLDCEGDVLHTACNMYPAQHTRTNLESELQKYAHAVQTTIHQQGHADSFQNNSGAGMAAGSTPELLLPLW